MYKLLTPDGAKKVAKEYSMRKAGVMLGLAVVLALFALISLLPSAILVYGRKSDALMALQSAKGLSGDAEMKSLQAWANLVKSDIRILAEGDRGEGPYRYFKLVLASKPGTVRVTGLSFDRGAESLSVRVSGIASDRQSLLLFQNNLRDSGDWAKTDFPVDALAKEKDVEFKFTLVPKP